MQRLIWVLLIATAAFAEPPCSLSSLAGTYYVAYSPGWAVYFQPGGAPPISYPGTLSGILSIGYDGTVTGFETLVGGTGTVEYEVSGTVEIQENCTGKFNELVRVKGTAMTPFPFTERLFAIADKQLIHATLINTGKGPVGAMGLGVWTKISHKPKAVEW